jgi:hypothetical protein
VAFFTVFLAAVAGFGWMITRRSTAHSEIYAYIRDASKDVYKRIDEQVDKSVHQMVATAIDGPMRRDDA